jgi:hypothetical protein
MPLLAGTVLSLAAVAAVASQDPGPVAFPRMSIRHPLASYLALGAAPFGNGLVLFALVGFIYAACIFIASWRYERRQQRGTAGRWRPARRGGPGQPVTPQPRPPGPDPLPGRSAPQACPPDGWPGTRPDPQRPRAQQGPVTARTRGSIAG